MAHHGDAAFDEPGGNVGDPTAPLELHSVHARLDEVDGIADRVLDRPVVGAEGHVADQQLVRGPTRHRARVVEHLLHRDGKRGGVTEMVVADAVADEEHRHLCFSQQSRDGGVVGGDHHEPLPTLLAGAKVMDGDRHRGHATRGWATTLEDRLFAAPRLPGCRPLPRVPPVPPGRVPPGTGAGSSRVLGSPWRTSR